MDNRERAREWLDENTTSYPARLLERLTALLDAKDAEIAGPGTLEARMNALADYTAREFGHDRYSAISFETTLREGIAKLRALIAAAEERHLEACTLYDEDKARAYAEGERAGLEKAARIIEDFDPDDFEIEPVAGRTLTDADRREAALLVKVVVTVLDHMASKIRALQRGAGDKEKP